MGLQFHEDPWVGYVTTQGSGMLLVPGLVFTVEPMINIGKSNIVTDKHDNWTVRTADGKWKGYNKVYIRLALFRVKEHSV
ncbi:M24 family metallopeptidase [Anoxybacterium hadale]|uniref:M24 family metallopeptidase n=1 Tax=Anoxybacterium hadale TaxID=3408580 RepID=UPI003AFF98B8